MDFVVKAKTPLFTGDASRGSRIIKETGIIGGLRWWYEALMRGMGRSICDPTIDKKCECDACKLFGNTSGARMFNLRFEDLKSQNIQTGTIGIKIGSGSGWYLPEGKMGEFHLSINGLRGNNSLVEKRVPALLKLVENWGAIGAKTYIGCGVFSLNYRDDKPFILSEADIDELLKPISNTNYEKRNEPCLSKIFFCKVNLDFSDTLKYDPRIDKFDTSGFFIKGIADQKLVEKCINKGFIPTSAHIRYQLRSVFRPGKSVLPSLSKIKSDKFNELLRKLRHDTIGNIEGEKKGSKIATSHFYLQNEEKSIWQMRIWGYVPERYIPKDMDYKSIVMDLKKCFEDVGFWKNCLNNDLLKLEKTPDFRYISCYSDDYSAFVKDLILNP